MSKNTKKISIIAMFSALIVVTTAYVKFPIAFGYVHAGDIFIIICCFFLPFYLAIPCVAIASMLADLVAGYVHYMLITLFAKAVLGLFCSLGMKDESPKLWKIIFFPTIGSILMVAIYFIFEGFFYNWPAAIANIPAQLIQPGFALPIAIIAIFAVSKIPYLVNFRKSLRKRDFIKEKTDNEDGN